MYRYTGTTDTYDWANSLVYSADGNIYSAGHFGVVNGNFVVISLTNTGTERWVYTTTGGEASSICFGADSNIYTSGIISDTFAVVSLNDSGVQRWMNKSRSGWAYSLALDNDGNCYAAGKDGLNSYANFLIISINNTGTQRWSYVYDGYSSNEEVAYSIIYGADGNIYSSGNTGWGNNSDFTVVSF